MWICGFQILIRRVYFIQFEGKCGYEYSNDSICIRRHYRVFIGDCRNLVCDIGFSPDISPFAQNYWFVLESLPSISLSGLAHHHSDCWAGARSAIFRHNGRWQNPPDCRSFTVGRLRLQRRFRPGGTDYSWWRSHRRFRHKCWRIRFQRHRC